MEFRVGDIINGPRCSNWKARIRIRTFARELAVVLAGALVSAHDALNVLVLVGTVSTVLRVLRGCLAVDERDF